MLIILLLLLLLLVGVVLPFLFKMVVEFFGIFWGTVIFIGAFALVGLFYLYDWWLDKHFL